MARPKEWERIARDQHISLQVLIDNAMKATKHLIMHCSEPLCREHALEIHTQLADAKFMSRELQSLIEDNHKPTSEEERWAFVQQQQQRANNIGPGDER